MIWTSILSLVGVALGWGLTEFTQVFKLRREEHRAIGRALTDLMLVHRRLLALKNMTNLMRSLSDLTPQQHLLFQQYVEINFLPDLEGLRKRYEESMKTVAGIDPLLGFELAQMDYFTPFVARLRNFAALNEEGSAAWASMEPFIADTSNLENIINRLASLHGRRTRQEIRNYLKEPLTLPSGFEELLKNVSQKEKDGSSNPK